MLNKKEIIELLDEFEQINSENDIECSYTLDYNDGGRINIEATLSCEKDDLKECLKSIQDLSDVLDNSNFTINLEIMEEKLTACDVESAHDMSLDRSLYMNPDSILFFVDYGAIPGGYALYATYNNKIYPRACEILKKSPVELSAFLQALEEREVIKARDIDFIGGKAIVPTTNYLDTKEYEVTEEEMDKFKEYYEYYRNSYQLW